MNEIGGKGLFTKEIEEALLAGEIQLAVHSMKDLPANLPDGLTMAAVLPREDPRDAFMSPVANSLAELRMGATIGFLFGPSNRAGAQAAARSKDRCSFAAMSKTRLRKLSEGVADATFLACAGLNRLGLRQNYRGHSGGGHAAPSPRGPSGLKSATMTKQHASC